MPFKRTIVRLTESDLHGIICEAVSRMLHENCKPIPLSGKPLYYMHVSQAEMEIPRDIYQTALRILKSKEPDFDFFNCLMWSPKENIIRFDYSEDFDTCTEPMPTKMVKVNYVTGDVTPGQRTSAVWHGKGNFWVDDAYKGFDVSREKGWRKEYMDTIKANSAFGKSPHGESRANWLNHLIDIGLIDRYFELNGIADPEEYIRNNSTGKFKNGSLLSKYRQYKNDTGKQL